MMQSFRLGKKSEVLNLTVCPKNIDNSTFFTPSIPEEVKQIIPILHELSIETSKNILHYVLNLSSSINEDLVFSNSFKSLGVANETSGVLISGIKEVIHSAIKSKVSFDVINADLKKMNFPEEFLLVFITEFKKLRKVIENNMHDNKIGFAKLSNFRWRVDIVITSGSLSRVMCPSIIFQVI